MSSVHKHCPALHVPCDLARQLALPAASHVQRAPLLQEPGQKIIDVDTAAQMLQLVLPQVCVLWRSGLWDRRVLGRKHGSRACIHHSPAVVWRNTQRCLQSAVRCRPAGWAAMGHRLLLGAPLPPAAGQVWGGLLHVPDAAARLQEDQY